MPRLSLLAAAALLSIAGTAGAAHAAPFAWQSAAAGASIRQADACGGYVNPGDADCDDVPDAQDKCPTQAGSDRTGDFGCPDADGDGTPDMADKCPAERGSGIDGCPTFHVGFNAYLPNAWFYSDGGGKTSGHAVVTLTRAAARKLHLSSTRIGSFAFDHRCGEGVICARMSVSAAVKRKIKRAEEKSSNPVYVAGKVSFVMTSPRVETITRDVNWGLGTNGGQYRVCGAGYTPVQYKGPICGGKGSSSEEG